MNTLSVWRLYSERAASAGST